MHLLWLTSPRSANHRDENESHVLRVHCCGPFTAGKLRCMPRNWSRCPVYASMHSIRRWVAGVIVVRLKQPAHWVGQSHGGDATDPRSLREVDQLADSCRDPFRILFMSGERARDDLRAHGGKVCEGVHLGTRLAGS